MTRMRAVILTNSEGRPGVNTAVEALRMGRTALDAIESGIRIVELDPTIRTVGFGGAPNILGEMELDASIMCGTTQRAGAVGALKGFLHPISVARQVMERTPHVMLVGGGAARFAAAIGAESGKLLSDESRAEYERWLADSLTLEQKSRWPDVPLHELIPPISRTGKPGGTTCFLARGNDGQYAGGVSTSGWAYKHPGRLGDSPVIGAGLYVDDRHGAAACTNTGEMTIRAGTSRAVVAYMKKGASVSEACREALDDLRALRGGYLGPVVVHAIDRDGNVEVAGFALAKEASYWYWRDGMDKPENRSVIHAG